MKISLSSLLVALACFAATVHAADDKIIAAVRAADDARLDATIAADRSRLESIYSDDLHYVHSSGRKDTKTSQLQGVTTGGSRYVSFDHKERTFVQAAPDIVLMMGHVLVNMSAKKDGARTTNDIKYLAVWRRENNRWRFLAWQAAKNTPPTAVSPK